MQALYRTHFQVPADRTNGDLADALADTCWKWLFDSKRRLANPEKMPTGCIGVSRLSLAPGTHTETILWREQNAIKWALAFVHPDPKDEHIQWRTELCVERLSLGQVFFSCSLYVGRTNESLAPFRRYTSRPRVVLDVLKQFHGQGSLPLTSSPLLLKPTWEYVDAFISLLTDPRRQHPVVYVSTHHQSESLLFDVTRLAEHLAGSAYVVTSASAEAASMLQSKMPPPLQAFDGAVRLYWPGFTFRSIPYHHPLWTKHRIVTVQTRGRDAFSKKLLSDIAVVSAGTVPQTMLTWARVEEAARHHAIAQAKEARNNADLLQLYEEDNLELRVKVSGLEQELRYKAEELYRTQARVAALENSAKSGDVSEQNIPPVESVAEAIDRACDQWPDQLVYSPNSKSEGDDSPFQPATEVMQALEWLVNVYHPAKLGKKSVTNFDANIREAIPGWGYAARQSEAATGRFKEWYLCTWESRTYNIAEHIGTGSSTRPEETIRIAFDWDKSRKRIVIGFIGQHQKNTKS